MEDLYAVLYQIVEYDDEYYEYEPCYVIKGTMQDGLFIDELGNSRLSIENPMSVEDGVCIGDVYTKAELFKKYPEATIIEEALTKLYQDEDKMFIYGNYDNDKKKMDIRKKDEDDILDDYDSDYNNDYEKQVFEFHSLDDIKNYINEFKEKYSDRSMTSVIITFPLETIEKLLDMDFADNEKSKDKKEPDKQEDLLSFINSGLGDLNKLVGLQKVKKTVKGIVATIVFKNKTKDNLKFQNDSKHMIFTGSPGTGKTTVAEILAPMLYKVGYLKSPKVKYISAQDLVGKYVGHTAPKTEALIESAKGGLIVLDEAYILAGEGQEFGNEAVTVILKEMEKNETMFIFAGYKDEMEKFVDMNSGIKSRIGKYIHFDDYSLDELYEIFDKTIKDISKDSKYGLIVEDAAIDKIKGIIKDAKKVKNFGNGRFIKNLCNLIIGQHAVNTYESDKIEELYTITEKDVPEDVFEKLFFDKKQGISMGFSADTDNKTMVKIKK